MTVPLIVLGVVVVLVLVAMALRRRRAPDPVDSFRRQIDALSPEARRPTIDMGRSTDDGSGPADEGGSSAS